MPRLQCHKLASCSLSYPVRRRGLQEPANQPVSLPARMPHARPCRVWTNVLFFFLDLDTLWLHRDIHRRRRSHPVRGSGQTECMHHTGSMSHSSFFQSSFVFVIAVAHSATLVGCTTRRLSIVTFRRGPLFHPHARLFFTSLGYTHARYGRSRACAVDAVCSQGWDWQVYRHRGLHRSGDGRGLDVSKGKSCSLVSRWVHVGCVVGDPRETVVDPWVDGSHVGGDGFW